MKVQQEFKPRDGDVFLESSRGLVSRLIRKFTRSRVSHSGLIFVMSRKRLQLLRDYGQKISEEWLNRPCVVEAGLRVRVRLLQERLSESSDMIIARRRGISLEQREALIRAALEFVGQRYGLARLFAFAKDILLQTRSVRRLALDVLVCSYLVAYPYAVLGFRFSDKRPREVTPEDILSTIKEDPDWTIYLNEGEAP